MDVPGRRRLGIALLVAGALAASMALALLLSPQGIAFQDAMSVTAAGRSLDSEQRSAPPIPGFNLQRDEANRFTLSLPSDFHYETRERDAWHLRGPNAHGLGTYIMAAFVPLSKPVTLDALNELRDGEVKRGWSLDYIKVTSEHGTLDGHPALNRGFLLGPYQGWEVVAEGADGYVAITFLCHPLAFPQLEMTFRNVLGGFRWATPASR